MPYLQYPRLFGDCWETSNLLSVEELGIKCTSYLQCTWLFGDCWSGSLWLDVWLVLHEMAAVTVLVWFFLWFLLDFAGFYGFPWEFELEIDWDSPPFVVLFFFLIITYISLLRGTKSLYGFFHNVFFLFLGTFLRTLIVLIWVVFFMLCSLGVFWC